MSKATILVVEDEAIVAADLAGKLTRLGYEVVGTTARGEEAVELTCRLHPQLVLMDISLEGSFDGIAAAEALRCQHDVPVIYLTAHSDPATLARAKLTGPFGYILKPFEERELVTQIELALYKHQADTQLREQREWLRVTLTSIGDAVIATDAAGRITFINPVAESLTGWNAEAASGQPVPDVFRIVNDHTGEPLEEPVARVLREGRTIELANHAAVVTKDGREVPIEDSAAPILDAAGRVIGVVLVFHDVTERRRAEETLRENEQRLHWALQGAGGGAWDWDLTRGEAWWSAEMYELWGVEPGTPMPLDNALSMVHEQDRERLRCAVEASLAGHTDFQCEFRIRHPRQGERWMASYGRAVHDESGRAARLLGISLDITERKRVEATLRENDYRWRTVSELVSDYAYSMSMAPDGTVASEWVTGAFERITGYGPGELSVPDLWHRLVVPEDVPLVLQRHAHLRAGQDDVSEFRIRTKSGEIHWLRDHARPEAGADPRGFIRIVGGVSDITERKHAEEALRQHVRALEEADGQKDEFLAMLAHELRNPLAPISAAVQLLDRPEADRMLVTKTCAVIGRQVRHMTRLVDDLLDVSRIRSGKIELQQEHVDLAEIFNGAIELNRDYIELRQHRLTVSQPASKVVVCGDRVRLTQIVSNLLHNAAKYMSDGGQIGLMIERMEEHVVIRVKDSGVGIAPAMLTRVFDLFVQADESLDRSQGGLGLGLTLVRQLVDLHGGTVEALSGGLHQGSEFVVRLPLVPQTAVQRVSLPELSADLASPAAYRILVVDDNDDAASMLAGLIELLGHHVKFVHDGSSALAAIESFRPDVVLLDIGLPEPNGYQVAEQVRLAYTSEEILLIALTGYGHDQAVQRGRQAGFDHHLVKPLNLDALRQLLAQYRPPPQIDDSEKCWIHGGQPVPTAGSLSGSRGNLPDVR